MCPFDFLKQFDEWFEWHRQVFFLKLLPYQVERNMAFNRSGWVLLKGMDYGGWKFSNAYNKTVAGIGSIGPFANDQLTTAENCTAIGCHAQACCCDGAIAVGDSTIATVENQHMIGDVLFGVPIPETVKTFFKSDPISSVWLLTICAYFMQDYYLKLLNESRSADVSELN